MADDLVERLRQYSGKSWETTECYNGVRDEAADTITRLRADLAAAERVIVAMRDGIQGAYDALTTKGADRCLSEALALTPESLSNMRLVPVADITRAVESIKAGIDSGGGCDHSVSICYCDEYMLLDRLAAYEGERGDAE